MKKILGIIFLLPSMLFAKELPIIPDVNCDSLKIKVGGVNESVDIYAQWETLEQFPNPSKKIYVGDYPLSEQEKFRIECPNTKVSFDGNTLTVQGDSLDRVLKYFYNGPTNVVLTGAFKDLYGSTIPLFSRGAYEYPNLKVGFHGNRYSINLENLALEEHNFILKEPRSYKDQYQLADLRQAVIGYKVDDKEIKPYFYNSILYAANSEFSNAKKIELFHKRAKDNDVGIMFEKIVIDKSTNTIQLIKKSDFPQVL